MELVTKKRLHLVSRVEPTCRWPTRSPRRSASSWARPTWPSSPTASSTAASASRCGAPTSSSSRPTAGIEGMSVNDAHHGAADHGRCRQAGLGQAHHRRVRPSTATPARTASPRAASRSRPSWWPTCSQAAGAERLISVDLHSGQIQGFFDGPVDHLTAMPVLSTTCPSSGEDLVVVSPDAGRVKVAERYANQLHADLAIVHKRRVKGVKNTGRGPRRRRRGGRPHLRPDRRHDRHRRHHRGRGRSAQGTGRAERSTPPAPTACSRARPSTGSRTRRSRKVVTTNTLPAPAREAARQDRGAVGGRHHRRRHRRGLRGHLGERDLRRAQPELSAGGRAIARAAREVSRPSRYGPLVAAGVAEALPAPASRPDDESVQPRPDGSVAGRSRTAQDPGDSGACAMHR